MINVNEKKIIRELARQVRDRAEMPIMQERREKWYAHNDLKSTEPVVAIFPEGAWREIITPAMLQCENEDAREMEWLLKARLFRADVMQDDVPTEKVWEVHKIITDTGWDALNPTHKDGVFANESYLDNNLANVPFVWKHDFSFEDKAIPFEPVINEPKDLKRLRSPQVTYHEKESLEKLKLQQDILGDILPVEFCGMKGVFITMMQTYSYYRGLEQVMYDIYDEPEMLHEAMAILEKGYHDLLDQYIDMGLLESSNTQGYNGTGGMCYTHDLPKEPGGGKSLKNVWGSTASQEFTMVGPEMHAEFVMQYEQRISERFGLASYGCCDAIEDKLKYVLDFKTIRRISVSPWADIDLCAERIGKKAIYSWKPNPAYFLNSYSAADEKFMEDYLKKMLNATKNNCAEIILKDTHTCFNDPAKFGQWVKLVRRCIEECRG